MRNNHQLKLAVRLLLLVLTAFAMAWTIFERQHWAFSLVLGTFLLIQFGSLIQWNKQLLKRINYFFESIKNDDFSQRFRTSGKNSIIQNLEDNMAQLNAHIQQMQINANQQEQYFRALIEQVATGILTCNEAGFVLHTNRSLKQLLSVNQLTHLKQLNKVDPQLAFFIQHIQAGEQKLIQLSGPSGKRTLLVKAEIFKSAGETLRLMSIQDINQELDEKELDSWLKLIRVLTHEIMNSIAPVTSLSESLGRYYQKEGEPIAPAQVDEKLIANTIRGLKLIQEQGKGLINFVESYRKFTRIPKPDKKILSVFDLLEKMALLRRAQLSNNKIEISVPPSTDKLLVLADEQLLSQVLTNLVKNAVEALKDQPNGRIVLSAQRSEGESVKIFVCDNGPGISKGLMDEIFVPFFTTRENGSGIGLSLSRQIMRLHGGRLTVSSVPFSKTCFTLHFA